VGIHLWSPPDRPEMRYPFVAYDYSMFYCLEWDRICTLQEGEVPEGSPLYLRSTMWVTRRRAETITGLYKVAEGETVKVKHRGRMGVPYDYFEAENVGEALLDTKAVSLFEATLRSRLVREALRRGWKISRSKYDENLLATYAVVEGIIPEKYVEPKPEMKIVSEAWRAPPPIIP